MGSFTFNFYNIIKEVDENLDKKVSHTEFDLMYKKCIEDKTG